MLGRNKAYYLEAKLDENNYITREETHIVKEAPECTPFFIPDLTANDNPEDLKRASWYIPREVWIDDPELSFGITEDSPF